MITSSSPILAATDVSATVDFYKDVLGFESSWVWGSPPTVGGARHGTVMIMFSQQLEMVPKIEGHQIWFDVEDVNALHAKHLERDAAIISPIEDKFWGKREYTVRDLNGYHLRFAGDLDYTPKGTGTFPDGVRIVRRLPTTEEYHLVAGNEFYKGKDLSDVLTRTWGGVIALDPDGAVIGTLRIMYDAPGWFSIWDVAVVPDWQNQRIGTAMMEEAMAAIRDQSPGAWVHLFTSKHGFYERIGFAKETVSLRKA
jgi:uncharacterized glyoxalase superfamily protein PhnB